MTKRDRWSSKMVFILVAVGSAVGLGNIWRFPYLAGKYGGGAFLLPYLVMLVIMGVPLLIMEFAIGQKMQQGAVSAFKKIDSRIAGIGLSSVLASFVIVSYYAVVMAWCIIYLINSFGLNWGTDTKSFLFNDVLHLSSSASEMGFISVPILASLVLVWMAIYFSVWKGTQSVGKVVLVTMPLPIILLFILLIRGVTLPGSMIGIMAYVKPDFQALFDFEVWRAAMSQIFFTLSLAFGVMIAYASYQSEESDITKSALLTAAINSLLSLIAGFAVFSTLGYMSLKSGVDIKELAAGGPGLAFIVFPKALSLIPGAPIFAVMFFVMLLTLGIDSAFSMVEAISTVIHDSYPNLRREDVSLYVCVFGFLMGIIFTTFNGLRYLDTTDHFLTNYSLVIIGLLQVIAVGWIYGATKLRTYINEVSDIRIGKWWDISIKYIIPILLIVLLYKSFEQDLAIPYEGYPDNVLLIFGWMAVFVVFFISILFSFMTMGKPEKD
jgi:neurotransmitter:Na+ symporter, NSS family